jgi:hypothetical protein
MANKLPTGICIVPNLYFAVKIRIEETIIKVSEKQASGSCIACLVSLFKGQIGCSESIAGIHVSGIRPGYDGKIKKSLKNSSKQLNYQKY